MMTMSALTLIAGSGNPDLAGAIAVELGVRPALCLIESFPDGELHVDVHESVRGHDVFIVQPTGPPVADHLMELLLLADACRRAGAARLTAVMPYFGYGRQDRRSQGREAVGARLVADLVGIAGFASVVAVDLHTPALEACFDMPLEHLSATTVLAKSIGPVAEDAIVVAPDLGAVRLAEQFSRKLSRPMATIHKQRSGPGTVRVLDIVGRVEGRTPIIVDDMISTGGTVAAAVRALLGAGCRPDLTVVASHGLLVGSANATLEQLPIGRLVTTDSVPVRADLRLPIEVVSLAPILAGVVGRLHRDESLSTLEALR